MRLAGVGRFHIFEIFRFCGIDPSPGCLFVNPIERRIFLADDLSDIALAGVWW